MDRSRIGKRKALIPNIQRRVRARRDEPEPEDVFSEEESDSDSQDHSGQDSGDDSDEEDVDESDLASEDEEEEDNDEDGPSIDASQVSFGALAKAQAALPSERRRKKGGSRGIGGSKDDDVDDGDDQDSDHPDAKKESRPARESSRPQGKKAPAKIGRANKHAPAEQSSKRQVSRRREVVSAARVAARDPRFDPLTTAGAGAGTAAADEDRARRAYAFLDEYREAEMTRLREAVRAAARGKDEAAREELKRALASMQDRKQAQQRRDEERALIAEHRRREKELVREGAKSQPFYLKRSEQRKQLLVDRFAHMKKSQVDHTIERRRKKLASRERREMPMSRRERS